MSKTIIFVEHGGIYKEFTLKKAKDFGFRIILATTKPEKLVYKYVNRADIVITDTFDSTKLVKDIRKFIKGKGILVDAVVTFKESSVIQTADLADALSLKGVGAKASRRSSQDKNEMRNFLKKNGFLNQPNFKLININRKIYKKEIEDFHKPCVIKPILGSSSHGVKKICENYSIDKEISDVKESMKPEDREVFKKFDGSMLIEEYVSGSIISVDGLVLDRKTHIIGSTQFIMGDEPYFQQVASFIPPSLDKKIISTCNRLTRKVIRILGFDTCGFHCEWKITTKNKPVLLEIAARTVGGGILLGYEKVTGVDTIDLLFKALTGEKIKLKLRSRRMCVLHKSVMPEIHEKSVLIKFEGFEKISQDKEVWHSLKFCSVGDILSAVPETPTQLYYYALEGKDIKSVIRKSEHLEKQVIYETRKIS